MDSDPRSTGAQIMIESSAQSEVARQALALGEHDTGTQARQLRQPWLNIARVVWVIVLVFNLAVLLIGTVLTYDQVRTVCDPAQDAYCGQDNRTPLDFAQTAQAQGISLDFLAGFNTFSQTFVALIYVVTSAFIFWQRSNDWLALLASMALLVFGTYIAGGMQWAILASLPYNPIWFQLGGFSIVLSIALIGLFTYLFPDGHFSPRWMGWVFIPFVAWFLLIDVIAGSPANSPVTLLPILTIAFTQVYRYQHTTDPLKRQQTKWFVLGIVVAVIGGIIANFLQPLSYSSSVPVWVGMAVSSLNNLANLAMQITLAIAILHYRVWDVDFLINRTLVYGTLTVLLIILFGISLLVVSSTFENFNGGQQSGVAIGATALVFGLLFQPSRRVLQRFVDRRFYGIRIDYQKPLRDAALAMPGTSLPRFGAYEVIESIGRGGMSEVYKGRHTTLNKPVAIKVLPQSLVKETDFRRRFEREAQTVAALKHPNIVEVYDFGEADGTPYMVMEFVAGQDLSDFLRANGRLAIAQAMPILREVASALDYAHSQGIVHRDIKASNIMLEPVTATGQSEKTYRAVLMDFGIAKIVGGGTRLTQHNMMGTLDYIAPEQIQAAAEVDGRADVYALGVLTYQLLTGELPFKTNNPGALLLAHLQQPAPDPRTICPDLPEKAAKAILRALAKSPAERYATAGEYVAALG